MKYFFATKYLQFTGYPELISIGIVSENDDYFYVINENFNAYKADQFVIDNILNYLPPPPLDSPVRKTLASVVGKWNSKCNCPWEPSKEVNEYSNLWKKNHQICFLLIKFLKDISSETLTENFAPSFGVKDITEGTEEQIMSKFGLVNYLWHSEPKEPIELWGYQASIDYTIIRYLYGNWPNGFPLYAKDVKQEADRIGFTDIPVFYAPDTTINKALWIKNLYYSLQKKQA